MLEGIFRPLFLLAAKYNLRLVLLNTRDYPESSQFTVEEAAAFSSTDPQVQVAAIRDLGFQVASFLAYFVRQNDIPKAKVDIEGRDSGGIVLLSWSLGNLLAMSLLGNVHTLPQEIKDSLGDYWRKLVMYGAYRSWLIPSIPVKYVAHAVCLKNTDPSLTTIGEQPPEGVYSPLRDTSLSLHERGQLFATWVSAYYPSVPPSLAGYSVPDLLARQMLANTSDYKSALPLSKRLSTVERMSSDEVKATTDFDVMERSTEAMRLIPRHVYRENVRRALWEPESDSGAQITFPHLKVLVLWFSMTMGDCVWAVKLLTDRKYQEDQTHNSRRRDVDIICVEGANHFVSPPVLFYRTRLDVDIDI